MNVQKTGILTACALFFHAHCAWADATLTRVTGTVMVHGQSWATVSRTPATVHDGETVRTAARGGATLTFKDGSRVEIAGNSSFTLEEAAPSSYGMALSFGTLKAFVARIASRKFEVRTPTAVCAVRGTEFQVEVRADGSTTVDLYKGLLAVQDHQGRELLLNPNERARVDMKGLETSKNQPSRGASERERFKNLMRREMALNLTREQIQAAAVRELKLADYQEGKSAVDVFGRRVRIEQYIVRPQPDQFKLVVLNNTKETFNYFFYLGTFNTILPTDLSVALSQLSGTVGAPPDYYLKSFWTGRSNTIDSIVEIANGGHPVNVNSNASGDPSEAVTAYFNAAQNSYVTIPAGTAFYKTLFDNAGFYVNGQLKSGWSGSGIQTYSQGFGSYSPSAATTQDPITGDVLAAALPVMTQSSTFPNASQIHQVIYDSYSDGTFIKWDNYILDNDGKIATAAQFQAPSSGSSFTEKLLNFNYQQVVTASEFGGRSIDLIVSPKMFVQSGLIQ